MPDNKAHQFHFLLNYLSIFECTLRQKCLQAAINKYNLLMGPQLHVIDSCAQAYDVALFYTSDF